jgi:hypothetical protein
VKFQLDEQIAQSLVVRCPRLQLIEVELDRQVGTDGHQILREVRVIGVGLQRLARSLLRDVIHMREDFLNRAELLDELHRGLGSDPANTRDVVRRIADQSQVVGHPLGRHAQALGGVRWIDELRFDGSGPAAPRVEQRDTFVDQLIEILVAGNDDSLQSVIGDAPGECADDVVRFVPLQLDDRDVEGIKDLSDTTHRCVEVFLKRLVQLLARGLVVRIDLVTERFAPTRVEDESEIVGPLFGEDFANELYDPPGRRRVLAPRGAERPADHGVESPINQRMPVD